MSITTKETKCVSNIDDETKTKSKRKTKAKSIKKLVKANSTILLTLRTSSIRSFLCSSFSFVLMTLFLISYWTSSNVEQYRLIFFLALPSLLFELFELIAGIYVFNGCSNALRALKATCNKQKALDEVIFKVIRYTKVSSRANHFAHYRFLAYAPLCIVFLFSLITYSF